MNLVLSIHVAKRATTESFLAEELSAKELVRWVLMLVVL